MSEASADSASSSDTGEARANEISAILDHLSQSLAHATVSYDETIALAVRTTSEIAGGPCMLWVARDGCFEARLRSQAGRPLLKSSPRSSATGCSK